MNQFVINGQNISNFNSLINEFNLVLFDNFSWHGSFDALNDLLRGGFGNIADTNYTIIWKSHEYSKNSLGYYEMKLWLEKIKLTAHESNFESINERIRNAELNIGDTLFDLVIKVIKAHGEGGTEAEDKIILVLD